jgi:hypothetical protein
LVFYFIKIKRYGGYLVRIQLLSIGGIMKVFGMMLISSLGFTQILSVVPLFGKAAAASQILLKIMKREPQIRFSEGKFKKVKE